MVDEADSALDPEDACQRAIESGLIVHRSDPLNCETPLARLGDDVTPTADFYARNHFQIPTLELSTWRLRISGQVERPLSLSLQDLKAMRSESQVVTLECAGNGRSMFSAATEGEQWTLGAVSTAEWTGVPLVDVLDRAGVEPRAREILFRGADRGSVEGQTIITAFERSLALDVARDSRSLLAYAMNGEPLPERHGYPLRLIVPGWYGVASVKWLTEIELIETAFAGYFQTDKYVYEWERDSEVVREPVNRMSVRALITQPLADQAVEAGDLVVRGMAWSGVAPIGRVEVRIGGGSWKEARLLGSPSRDRWQEWELIATRVFDYAEQAVRGGVSTDTALARLDREVDQILERRRWLLSRNTVP